MLEENPLGHISVPGTCSVGPTHTIGTKEDYYDMGGRAGDSPREWILEAEKSTSPQEYDGLLPYSFFQRRKVVAQRRQVPCPKSHSQWMEKPGREHRVLKLWVLDALPFTRPLLRG